MQVVDPAVSRAKFDQEIAEFRELGDEYRRRGWCLVEAQWPRALVLLAAPQLNPPALIWGVSFDYTNYDAAPPSVQMVHPITREPYRYKDVPNPLNYALPQQEVEVPGLPQRLLLQGAQAYLQAHDPADVPFLCLPGVLEYHEHPAHTGDPWELHRSAGAGRLVRLLEIIYRYGVSPIAGYGVQLVPQIRINYGPPPA